MKNLAKTTGLTKTEVQQRNEAKAKFESWLKATQEKQAELDKIIEAKKATKKVGSQNFKLSDNVLLEIRLAGEKGITIGEIMTKQPKQFFKKNKQTGELEQQLEFSIDTVARDWNKQDCLIQYGQKQLMKNGLYVPFKVEATPKADNLTCGGNNRISIDEFSTFAPIVDEYLMNANNFNPEWLK